MKGSASQGWVASAVAHRTLADADTPEWEPSKESVIGEPSLLNTLRLWSYADAICTEPFSLSESPPFGPVEVQRSNTSISSYKNNNFNCVLVVYLAAISRIAYPRELISFNTLPTASAVLGSAASLLVEATTKCKVCTAFSLCEHMHSETGACQTAMCCKMKRCSYQRLDNQRFRKELICQCRALESTFWCCPVVHVPFNVWNTAPHGD